MFEHRTADARSFRVASDRTRLLKQTLSGELAWLASVRDDLILDPHQLDLIYAYSSDPSDASGGGTSSRPRDAVQMSLPVCIQHPREVARRIRLYLRLVRDALEEMRNDNLSVFGDNNNNITSSSHDENSTRNRASSACAILNELLLDASPDPYALTAPHVLTSLVGLAARHLKFNSRGLRQSVRANTNEDNHNGTLTDITREEQAPTTPPATSSPSLLFFTPNRKATSAIDRAEKRALLGPQFESVLLSPFHGSPSRASARVTLGEEKAGKKFDDSFADDELPLDFTKAQRGKMRGIRGMASSEVCAVLGCDKQSVFPSSSNAPPRSGEPRKREIGNRTDVEIRRDTAVPFPVQTALGLTELLETALRSLKSLLVMIASYTEEVSDGDVKNETAFFGRLENPLRELTLIKNMQIVFANARIVDVLVELIADSSLSLSGSVAEEFVAMTVGGDLETVPNSWSETVSAETLRRDQQLVVPLGNFLHKETTGESSPMNNTCIVVNYSPTHESLRALSAECLLLLTASIGLSSSDRALFLSTFFAKQTLSKTAQAANAPSTTRHFSLDLESNASVKDNLFKTMCALVADDAATAGENFFSDLSFGLRPATIGGLLSSSGDEEKKKGEDSSLHLPSEPLPVFFLKRARAFWRERSNAALLSRTPLAEADNGREGKTTSTIWTFNGVVRCFVSLEQAVKQTGLRDINNDDNNITHRRDSFIVNKGKAVGIKATDNLFSTMRLERDVKRCEVGCDAFLRSLEVHYMTLSTFVNFFSSSSSSRNRSGSPHHTNTRTGVVGNPQQCLWRFFMSDVKEMSQVLVLCADYGNRLISAVREANVRTGALLRRGRDSHRPEANGEPNAFEKLDVLIASFFRKAHHLALSIIDASLVLYAEFAAYYSLVSIQHVSAMLPRPPSGPPLTDTPPQSLVKANDRGGMMRTDGKGAPQQDQSKKKIISGEAIGDTLPATFIRTERRTTRKGNASYDSPALSGVRDDDVSTLLHNQFIESPLLFYMELTAMNFHEHVAACLGRKDVLGREEDIMENARQNSDGSVIFFDVCEESTNYSHFLHKQHSGSILIDEAHNSLSYLLSLYSYTNESYSVDKGLQTNRKRSLRHSLFVRDSVPQYAMKVRQIPYGLNWLRKGFGGLRLPASPLDVMLRAARTLRAMAEHAPPAPRHSSSFSLPSLASALVSSKSVLSVLLTALEPVSVNCENNSRDQKGLIVNGGGYSNGHGQGSDRTARNQASTGATRIEDENTINPIVDQIQGELAAAILISLLRSPENRRSFIAFVLSTCSSHSREEHHTERRRSVGNREDEGNTNNKYRHLKTLISSHLLARSRIMNVSSVSAIAAAREVCGWMSIALDKNASFGDFLRGVLIQDDLGRCLNDPFNFPEGWDRDETIEHTIKWEGRIGDPRGLNVSSSYSLSSPTPANPPPPLLHTSERLIPAELIREKTPDKSLITHHQPPRKFTVKVPSAMIFNVRFLPSRSALEAVLNSQEMTRIKNDSFQTISFWASVVEPLRVNCAVSVAEYSEMIRKATTCTLNDGTMNMSHITSSNGHSGANRSGADRQMFFSEPQRENSCFSHGPVRSRPHTVPKYYAAATVYSDLAVLLMRSVIERCVEMCAMTEGVSDSFRVLKGGGEEEESGRHFSSVFLPPLNYGNNNDDELSEREEEEDQLLFSDSRILDPPDLMRALKSRNNIKNNNERELATSLSYVSSPFYNPHQFRSEQQIKQRRFSNQTERSRDEAHYTFGEDEGESSQKRHDALAALFQSRMAAKRNQEEEKKALLARQLAEQEVTRRRLTYGNFNMSHVAKKHRGGGRNLSSLPSDMNSFIPSSIMMPPPVEDDNEALALAALKQEFDGAFRLSATLSDHYHQRLKEKVSFERATRLGPFASALSAIQSGNTATSEEERSHKVNKGGRVVTVNVTNTSALGLVSQQKKRLIRAPNGALVDPSTSKMPSSIHPFVGLGLGHGHADPLMMSSKEHSQQVECNLRAWTLAAVQEGDIFFISMPLTALSSTVVEAIITKARKHGHEMRKLFLTTPISGSAPASSSSSSLRERRWFLLDMHQAVMPRIIALLQRLLLMCDRHGEQHVQMALSALPSVARAHPSPQVNAGNLIQSVDYLTQYFMKSSGSGGGGGGGGLYAYARGYPQDPHQYSAAGGGLDNERDERGSSKAGTVVDSHHENGFSRESLRGGGGGRASSSASSPTATISAFSPHSGLINAADNDALFIGESTVSRVPMAGVNAASRIGMVRGGTNPLEDRSHPYGAAAEEVESSYKRDHQRNGQTLFCKQPDDAHYALPTSTRSTTSLHLMNSKSGGSSGRFYNDDDYDEDGRRGGSDAGIGLHSPAAVISPTNTDLQLASLSNVASVGGFSPRARALTSGPTFGPSSSLPPRRM